MYQFKNISILLIPFLLCVNSENAPLIQTENRELVITDPCTGMISNDYSNPYENNPCLFITSSPTTSQDIPSEPTDDDEDEPTDDDEDEYDDKITCPDQDCNFDEDDESIVLVQFKYAVETTNDVEDPTTLLPQLEETLLKKLAEKLLFHCIADFDFRILMRKRGDTESGTNASTSHNKKYQRRMLKSRRRLETVGICSAPIDEHVEEEACSPELDETNNCFVIDGRVTVKMEEGDSLLETITNVKESTKQTMNDGELVTDDNPNVKKVTYIEDDIVIPPAAPLVTSEVGNGGNVTPIIIGASLLALFVILAAAALKMRKNKTTVSEGDMVVTAKTGSFIAADRGNLGKHATVMDVHECKSSMCPKCYVDPSILFVSAPPTPRPPSTPQDTNQTNWQPRSSEEFTSASESSSVGTAEYY